MLYESTRGNSTNVKAHEAILSGIAPDGGLFVPIEKIKVTLNDLSNLMPLSYHQRAAEILKYFLDDYDYNEILNYTEQAYSSKNFSHNEIAPVVKLSDKLSVLELWHGPTCAFKDMALQLLPHLLTGAVKKAGEDSEIVILVATSGDTGKAALEAFKDIAGTKVVVFYPQDGVSQIQKLQMITQEGKNVFSIGVNGNFDDAQTGVKNIFANEEFNAIVKSNNKKLSSANSINWGRLVPQIVYYFSAYCDLLKAEEIKLGEEVNFIVPTGNFGNILSAYYAKNMGLPIAKLICASNENNVLTDFINNGVYDKNRDFVKTMSPSMDILISSNLERLMYHISNNDSSLVNLCMNKLSKEGIYSVDEETKKGIENLFWAGYANEDETKEVIKNTYDKFKYVVDPHTAVAFDVYHKYTKITGDDTKSVIVSTASPFKFSDSVVKAIWGNEVTEGKNEFDLLELLSKKTGLPIPSSLAELRDKAVVHKDVSEKTDLENILRTKIFG